MNIWPFRKEVRSEPSGADYTQVLVNLLQSQAEGNPSDPSATAAFEAAAGLIARAFAVASVEPSNIRTECLTPSMLAGMARSLIHHGEALYVINLHDARCIATPCSHWEVYGNSSNPMEWRYRCDVPSPDGTRTLTLPAEGVLHFKYAYRQSSPWRGIGPLQWAAQTARLHGAQEQALAGEASGPYGHVLPLPDVAQDKDQKAQIISDLKKLNGGVKAVDTVATGWGEGKGSAPSGDWVQKRIGMEPEAPTVALRSDVAQAVLAACGVPTPLVTSGEGSSAREAWRRFLHSTAQPLASLAAQEARLKLGVPDLAITFNRLFASDLSGRARAFQSMVGGGMDIQKAAALAGLMETED